MIDIIDFTNCIENDRYYGGHAGTKLGIKYNNENWFLKFPQSTKEFKTREISYTTAPLSEYIGSHIYQMLGIKSHDTLLGTKDGKIVVACRDFLLDGDRLIEFGNIRNRYVKGLDDTHSSSKKNSVDLNDIMLIMDKNPVFMQMPKLKEHFWNMFVIDAFISNSDRNDGNWGILNHADGSKEIAPVYDNGNSFNNNVSDERLLNRLSNETAMRNTAYISRSCIFSLDEKKLNPFVYMENSENPDLNEAIKRIVPNIDLQQINQFIDDIPVSKDELLIMSDTRKAFYKQTLELRYRDILQPVYTKIIEKELQLGVRKNLEFAKESKVKNKSAPHKKIDKKIIR